MLETLSLTEWNGPYEPAVKARAIAGLEAGAVLFFPGLAFGLADSEKQFLDARVSDGKAKNISLDPDTGKIQATSLQGDEAHRLSAMMARFADQASSLVRDLLPYTQVERARTSYRPVEVKGRGYSKISDDRLLHIDAFPSRRWGRDGVSCASSPMSRRRRPGAGWWVSRSNLSRAIFCRGSARIRGANPGSMKNWASPADAAVSMTS